MISPGTHNITAYQNATWRGQFRATEGRQQITNVSLDGTTLRFICPCHGYSADQKVVFTDGSTVPCGFALNTIYYVISSGLTTDEFQVSATQGGATLSVSGNLSNDFYVSTPLDLTSYAVDSDIKVIADSTSVASFTPSITDATNGAFELTLAPATTEPIAPGVYGYDVSLTSSGGERYYWIKGTITVEKTYSRNA